MWEFSSTRLLCGCPIRCHSAVRLTKLVVRRVPVCDLCGRSLASNLSGPCLAIAVQLAFLPGCAAASRSHFEGFARMPAETERAAPVTEWRQTPSEFCSVQFITFGLFAYMLHLCA